jgi:hypothetical protein
MCLIERGRQENRRNGVWRGKGTYCKLSWEEEGRRENRRNGVWRGKGT